ncbi:MAG: tRNA lysidine(34) synthetase TilS, partial [Saprospiraceae bacterium]|nr:tRNA lysidine(34) synthetase TilS [Saprospiraceae bacterium]
MLHRFIDSIERYADKEQRFLLAVSGGLDSTLLVHFALEAGLDIGIGHCNYQLRGAESDAEEIFVKKLALGAGVPFYAVKFDTKEWLKEHNLTLQEGARQLRYSWLEEILEHNGFDHILTAHHVNDSLETFLYNFSKGTGLKGLTGIPPQNGKIVRPMLAYSRPELKQYARDNGIDYCLDSSNEKDDYARNKIRHHIVPILKEINPSLEETFKSTLSNLQRASAFIDTHIRKLYEETVHQEGTILYFSKAKLQHHPNLSFFLFETLQSYGFNGAVIKDMIEKGNQP